MNEFSLLFRNEKSPAQNPSPEQMQAILKQWQDWMQSLASGGHLASAGNRLSSEGLTLNPGNVIVDGPFAEIKEMISGYIVVNAGTLTEATELAKGCPILKMGGSVEVRLVIPMNM